jgi:acetyl-CoA C-acetyltransferase
MGSPLPVNPSGGALSSNPVGATSLIRIAEAALQVTNQAGERQVEGASVGLAQCSGGSVQFGCVVILKNGDAV